MSSILKKFAFASLALVMAFPALAASSPSEWDEGAGWARVPAEQVERLAGPSADTSSDSYGAAGGVAAPSDGRPVDHRIAGTSRPLAPGPDGENDELESVDETGPAGASAAPRLARERVSVGDQVQRGFSEGLFGARASRGPPQG